MAIYAQKRGTHQRVCVNGKTLSVPALREFLEKHPRMVFQRGSSKMCPIARFFGNSARGTNVGVGCTSIRGNADDTEGRTPLPKWARDFITRFDDGPTQSALGVLLDTAYRAVR